MPAIVRDGQRVVFDELGRSGSRVVVLAHNLLAHRGSFTAVAARLAPRAHVVNVDLRGHGDSRGTARAFSTADLAADLAAVLDSLAARDAIVVGTSLGAAAAVELARARPEQIGALVLTAANPYTASARDRLTFGALATILRTLGPAPVLASVLAGLHAPDAAADVRGATTAHLQAMDRRDMARAVRCWVARPALLDGLGGLRLPVRVVVGGADSPALAAAGRVLADRLGADLRTIAGAGHTVQAERPAEVAAIVEELLVETGP
ncbi:alpha/beta fold hydrolase [Nannocystis punicea]|uniref:Alpha/beta hydrolase n=1 Tax=Nannocystis punicea TaxID=2995304 RepID=A0ABY7HI98_9BACT|nr:alpha/beta hydrolase [Nannocystis poenicansa]WAS99042.1 alpha/beta hydrolase [Nannocystis poenicansa]